MSFLSGRGAVELRLIGALSAVWPFVSDDTVWSAAYGLDAWKRRYPLLVEPAFGMAPEHAADMVVDCILSHVGKATESGEV